MHSSWKWIVMYMGGNKHKKLSYDIRCNDVIYDS
jgi:hypothetical protein